MGRQTPAVAIAVLGHHWNLLAMGRAPNLMDIHLNHLGTVSSTRIEKGESRDDHNA